MPRYFFATRVGADLLPDPEGRTLRDADEAWEVARNLIREVLRESGPTSRLLSAILEVTDEAGEIVFEFPFSEAVVPPGEPGGTLH
ncbi:DUF6894 family protein [Methylobacterium nodulans]|uniref:DUF6894 domain-containing protein n=1 Tax=Methylobacterium nodulans (strain LMG 21967 / CNCM I-2342 / ORS 2060) TaxID=460265 RepID=B8ID38_METNO|nr:hypothetical protein [Methylobacterium nodulans]ACL59430.1 conserved hypothetical protein [Methylobacterium nodulans ORS 2060]